MNNKEALKFFENMSIVSKDNPKCVKMKGEDMSSYDVDFILKYASKNSEILDLGSGTGLIVNKIYDKIASIDCVEPLIGFSGHIVKSSNVKIFNENMFDFKTDKKYDLVTIFGTLHYFNQEEAVKIYKKYIDYLKPTGKIIIKNQFGINEDVLVAGYSEEQKANYFAQYRHLDKEVKLLCDIGFKNIHTFDIYPPEANRWQNTHFYAIVADKN